MFNNLHTAIRRLRRRAGGRPPGKHAPGKHALGKHALGKHALGKHALGDRRGAMAVEFALLLPALVAVLLILMEGGRALWIQNSLQLAVDEAARYAAANPEATTAQITATAAGRLPGLDPADFAFSVTTEASDTPAVSFVTVQGSYAYALLVPLMSNPDDPDAPVELQLNARSRVPVLAH